MTITSSNSAQINAGSADGDYLKGPINYVDGSGSAAGVGFSPEIWSDCPRLSIMLDPTIGIRAGDRFTTVQATGFPYELSGTNGTFAAVAGAPGTARLNAPGTDNDEAHIAYNNDVGGLIKMDAAHKWWYEARVKLSQITVEGGVLVGFLQQAASQDAIMATDSMILTATLDYLGFQIVEATAPSTMVWRTINQLAARTAISESAAACTTGFVKLGMKSVPNAGGTVATVTFYVDGVALPDTTTTAGTNFPLNQYLIPQFGIKTGAGSAFGLTFNWWEAVQLY